MSSQCFTFLHIKGLLLSSPLSLRHWLLDWPYIWFPTCQTSTHSRGGTWLLVILSGSFRGGCISWNGTTSTSYWAVGWCLAFSGSLLTGLLVFSRSVKVFTENTDLVVFWSDSLSVSSSLFTVNSAINCLSRSVAVVISIEGIVDMLLMESQLLLDSVFSSLTCCGYGRH